jgi:hypothetical protein
MAIIAATQTKTNSAESTTSGQLFAATPLRLA